MHAWDIYDDIIAVRVRSRLQGREGGGWSPDRYAGWAHANIGYYRRTRVGRPSPSHLCPPPPPCIINIPVTTPGTTWRTGKHDRPCSTGGRHSDTRGLRNLEKNILKCSNVSEKYVYRFRLAPYMYGNDKSMLFFFFVYCSKINNAEKNPSRNRLVVYVYNFLNSVYVHFFSFRSHNDSRIRSAIFQRTPHPNNIRKNICIKTNVRL